MNQYYFNTIPLITAQNTRTLFETGYYGGFSGVSKAKEISIVSRYVGSGNARLTIQGKSPIDSNENYNLIQIDYAGTSGYKITGLTLPVENIRSFISGSGTWDCVAVLAN